MDIERLKDLSIYYWLVDLFSSSPFIKVEDGFPISEVEPPVVAVEYKTIVLEPLELGNSYNIFRRSWYIEIIAKTKSQRDEIAFKIARELKNNIPVYNYNEGFPPSVTPSQLGCLIVKKVSIEPIRISPQLMKKLYYRASVSFDAELDKSL